MSTAVVLSMAGSAWADGDAPVKSGGNWFTRLFHRQATASPGAEERAPASTTKADPNAAARVRAEMELLRRQEVCDKLREIALQNGDDELRRKADQLDQRAWEAYLQKTGRTQGNRGALTADEQALEAGLGLGSRQAGTPATSSRRPSQVQGQAARKGN